MTRTGGMGDHAAELERLRRRVHQLESHLHEGPEDEDRLCRAVVRAAQEPMALVDDRGYCCMASDAFLAIWGASREEATGVPYKSICGEALFDQCFAPLLTQHPTGGGKTPSVSIACADGLTRRFELRAASVAHGDRPPCTLLSLKDVTQVEDLRLHHSHERKRLELALEVGRLAWWEWDAETGVVHGSPGKMGMLGYPPEECVDQDVQWWIEQIHPDEREAGCDAMRNHLDGEADHYDITYRLKTAGGGWRWFEDRGRIVERTADGKPKRVLGVAHDIEERMEREHEVLAGELKYRALFDAAPVGLCVCDEAGRILQMNQSALEILGMAAPQNGRETIDGSGWDIVDESGAPMPPEEFPSVRALKTGKPAKTDMMGVKLPDGRRVWLTVKAVPLEAGVIRAIIGFQDVSALKEAQDALRASEEQIITILEHLPAGVFCHDLDGRFVLVNTTACCYTGWSREELLSKNVADIDPAVVSRNDRERFWQRMHAGSHERIETRHRRKDGSTYPVEVLLNATHMHSRPVILAVALDISARKKAEEALRASNERFRLLYEASSAGIATADCDTFQVLSANPAVCAMLGYTERELCEKTVLDLTHPEDIAFEHEAVAQAAADPEHFGIHGYEKRLIRKDGECVWVHMTSVLLPDYQGRKKVALAVVVDVTEQRKGREALEESERRIREIVETVPYGVVETDTAGVITFCNSAWLPRHGLEAAEAIGHAVFAFMPPGEATRLRKMLAEMHAFEPEPALLTIKQTQFDPPQDIEVAWNYKRNAAGKVTGFVFVTMDVTERNRAEAERRQLEAKLAQAQKLDSLAVLAGGVAHDFNNILMAVLGNAELGLSELQPVSPARPFLEEVMKAAQRAADLSMKMLAYSGQGRMRVEKVEAAGLVRDLAPLMRSSLPRNALLEFDIVEPSARVQADANQFRQMLLNLVVNAGEALEEGPGTITISVFDRHYEQEELASPYLSEVRQAGRYVCIRVRDTGCGMDATAQTRLFDPFFSTKFTGRGLGLAAVLGIVRGHKGTVHVESMPGEGSSIQVLMPAYTEKLTQDKEETSSLASWQGSGRVLLVDDDAPVRLIAERLLVHLGFDVDLAADGEEGLRKALETPGCYVCIILDLSMPGLSGDQAFVQMRKGGIEAPIILTSGFAHDELIDRFPGLDFAGILQKPFDRQQLAELLKRVTEDYAPPEA